ncbi:Nse4 C-terminal-domain-containing protein [Suillus fuscotomentosus]|uniref:Non-structural maintenance of chromosomes element 4 n=1 Tax=Suillus fuscotomentosus TaxID=1912939 RepID=A0AAD4DV74_9AGAM|nr:Nse4 C-terminal-domain-containing protein [Suillus fuscotomentosus]KAG1894489.1 Nse4 C-terminal-domain-containing protein [Suillus fuscotomentosus]
MAEDPLTITADEFTTKVAAYLAGGTADERDRAWERVGMRALSKSRRVPVQSFMHGAILPSVVGVDCRELSACNADEGEAHTEVADHSSTREDTEESVMVAQLAGILQATGPLNLFRFIIHPLDFGQSVENLYYLSFLICDGMCGLHMADNGKPILTPRQPSEHASMLDTQVNRQTVMEFDMATWKRAIEVFDIQESIILCRSPGRV